MLRSVEATVKSLLHIVVPWKSRNVLPKNLNFSELVITEKPNDLVQVCSTLDTAGKTSLSTPNPTSICKFQTYLKLMLHFNIMHKRVGDWLPFQARPQEHDTFHVYGIEILYQQAGVLQPFLHKSLETIKNKFSKLSRNEDKLIESYMLPYWSCWN